MPLRKMKVSEWIKVKDNPIQRDTERHAAKAKHLLTPLPIHAIVYAAELPNGTLVKLDGHTRALLWKRNQVQHPPEVEVNIIRVADIEEAKRLYKTIDSRDAVETIPDKISGAFNSLNFSPESGLLKQGNIAHALRISWNIKSGYSPISSGPKNKLVPFELYEAVTEFSSEIFALDSFPDAHVRPTSGIVAAFILTMRKHGKNIVPFWQMVFANGGEKKNGKMDGVQALNELILGRKGRAYGGSATIEMASRAVMAAEKWLADEELSAIPRPFDLTGYIDHKKAAVALIKGKPTT